MNISSLNWSDSILCLAKRKPTKTLLSLESVGFTSISDLLWIIPLRVIEKPKIQSFEYQKVDQLFFGKGKVLNIKSTPAFGKRGKGKIQLFNITVIVKDLLSSKIATLQFFNTYPNIKKQISALEEFTFMGTPGLFKGNLNIVNPKIDPSEIKSQERYLIEYPTISSISGIHIKKIIDLIPTELWDKEIPSPISQLSLPETKYSLREIFFNIHGKNLDDEINREKCFEDLKYYELVEEQIKVKARKESYKLLKSKIIQWRESTYNSLLKKYPYELTEDQINSINDIKKDFCKGSPMMRILQGDVGCGKTTVAVASLIQVIENGYQVALMCPTEALAKQHQVSIKDVLNSDINVQLLLGSHTQKKKKEIYENLSSGKTQLVIGTHSLFQDKVEFKNLMYVIIDEQHKFGVNQRLKLISKGDNPHTLIMSATPIPRTLQLSRYGDLDISSIKTMPRNRIPIKTRIVTPKTFDKYLSFIKTRVSIGEQVYIVTPAIEESEAMDLESVTNVYQEITSYFPELNIQCLHGKMNSQEKDSILQDFKEHKINILISTSVIEVGINILNATVMSIFNPDRFGLSSLHQLRGRVGRSTKASFCFLVTKKQLPQESLERLKVIEQSTDGFQIAQADLTNRGQGDLFGTDQSGSNEKRKLTNIFKDFDLFNQVIKDMEYIEKHNNLFELMNHYNLDKKVSSTI